MSAMLAVPKSQPFSPRSDPYTDTELPVPAAAPPRQQLQSQQPQSQQSPSQLSIECSSQEPSGAKTVPVPSPSAMSPSDYFPTGTLPLSLQPTAKSTGSKYVQPEQEPPRRGHHFSFSGFKKAFQKLSRSKTHRTNSRTPTLSTTTTRSTGTTTTRPNSAPLSPTATPASYDAPVSPTGFSHTFARALSRKLHRLGHHEEEEEGEGEDDRRSHRSKSRKSSKSRSKSRNRSKSRSSRKSKHPSRRASMASNWDAFHRQHEEAEHQPDFFDEYLEPIHPLQPEPEGCRDKLRPPLIKCPAFSPPPEEMKEGQLEEGKAEGPCSLTVGEPTEPSEGTAVVIHDEKKVQNETVLESNNTDTKGFSATTTAVEYPAIVITNTNLTNNNNSSNSNKQDPKSADPEPLSLLPASCTIAAVTATSTLPLSSSSLQRSSSTSSILPIFHQRYQPQPLLLEWRKSFDPALLFNVDKALPDLPHIPPTPPPSRAADWVPYVLYQEEAFEVVENEDDQDQAVKPCASQVLAQVEQETSTMRDGQPQEKEQDEEESVRQTDEQILVLATPVTLSRPSSSSSSSSSSSPPAPSSSSPSTANSCKIQIMVTMPRTTMIQTVAPSIPLLLSPRPISRRHSFDTQNVVQSPVARSEMKSLVRQESQLLQEQQNVFVEIDLNLSSPYPTIYGATATTTSIRVGPTNEKESRLSSIPIAAAVVVPESGSKPSFKTRSTMPVYRGDNPDQGADDTDQCYYSIDEDDDVDTPVSFNQAFHFGSLYERQGSTMMNNNNNTNNKNNQVGFSKLHLWPYVSSTTHPECESHSQALTFAPKSITSQILAVAFTPFRSSSSFTNSSV